MSRGTGERQDRLPIRNKKPRSSYELRGFGKVQKDGAKAAGRAQFFAVEKTVLIR